MGGYGSGQWNWYNKKTTVEECLRLNIKAIYKTMQPGYWGSLDWSINDQKTGSISFRVEGDYEPKAVRLIYTQSNRSTGKKTDLDYRIPLMTTSLPWGGVRYWFACPLRKNGVYCGRRVGVLYLPPGYQFFGCRHCYELTYRSCQESHRFDKSYAQIAEMMWQEMPGLTSKDIRYLFEKTDTGNPPSGGYFEGQYKDLITKYLEEVGNSDPHAHYLSLNELLEQSGLSSSDLENLEAARLLIPDTKDRVYRPKLAGWGRKLAYLLAEGWDLNEIRRWSKGRWSSPDPRQWPPDRNQWKE